MVYTVGITGYPSSGKSVAKEIAKDIGFKTVTMGDQVRRKTRENWSKRLNKAENEESNEKPSEVYSQFATEMREKHGQEIVAQWCVEDINKYENPVFLDGIRSPQSREVIESFTEFDLVYVHAPASLRLKWIRERGRDNEENFTCEEFLERDRTENKWGLNELIKNSDYTIHNCGDINDYKQNIRSLLNNIYNNHQ